MIVLKKYEIMILLTEEFNDSELKTWVFNYAKNLRKFNVCDISATQCHFEFYKILWCAAVKYLATSKSLCFLQMLESVLFPTLNQSKQIKD